MMEFFWRHVDLSGLSGSCWPWTGRKNAEGYGHVRLETTAKSPQARCHRLVWQMVFGPIPQDLGVLHRCDNTAYVNPFHLFLGTQHNNMVDAHRKGRLHIDRAISARVAKEKAKKLCPRGHPYSGPNLIQDKRGWRACRICVQASNHRSYLWKSGNAGHGELVLK